MMSLEREYLRYDTAETAVLLFVVQTVIFAGASIKDDLQGEVGINIGLAFQL